MDRVLTEFEAVTETVTGTPGAAAWTARERDSGRSVLIKRLPEEAGRARATQALALQHPNIVPTRRWLRDEGQLYIVRDYVTGRSLRQTLTDTSQRAFDRLLARISPLLDVLDYAHRSGVAHGGVTPDNVLVDEKGRTQLSDFATVDNRSGSRARYAPRSLMGPDGAPTPQSDYYALCELCKEFLPERPADDEAGVAARTRLLRNLSEVQQSAGSLDELRYKLDAVAKMADLLGFASRGLPEEKKRLGARLVCTVTPPTATLNPGGGTSVTLTLRNEGDSPLQVEAVGSSAVWLNPLERFAAFLLPPDGARDLPFAVSGARLQPGTYNPSFIVRSSSGLVTPTPPPGTPWPEMAVALPVLVGGMPEGGDAAPDKSREPEPDITPVAAPQSIGKGAPASIKPSDGAPPGIACLQEPDPALVRYGQIGVVHIGVRNIGAQRLRLDKISTWPPWLSYPGDFQAIWIEPGETQYLGLSIVATTLTGGDYKAEVTFITSATTETMLGPQPVWREMKCDVRVRVVRGVGDSKTGVPGAQNAGCASVLVTLLALSSLGIIGTLCANFLH